MAPVLPASELTLNEVESRFALRQVDASDFFPECQVSSPQLTDYDGSYLIKLALIFATLLNFQFMKN